MLANGRATSLIYIVNCKKTALKCSLDVTFTQLSVITILLVLYANGLFANSLEGPISYSLF